MGETDKHTKQTMGLFPAQLTEERDRQTERHPFCREEPQSMLLVLLRKSVLYIGVCLNAEHLYLGGPQTPEFVPPSLLE